MSEITGAHLQCLSVVLLEPFFLIEVLGEEFYMPVIMFGLCLDWLCLDYVCSMSFEC